MRLRLKHSLPLRGKFFILIVILAFVLRFYKLGEVPLGFHQDEASQAYNSFSILTSARDRYGQFLPILSRSFGSYQPTVYTYLTTIPILLFGNTIFAARSTSALFGVLTVIVTYLIVNSLVKLKYRYNLALLSAFVVAISPWSIHFSRRVVEGNLGLFFFLLALYFLLLSLKKIKYILPATLFLGISTHAYYSERLISVIFFSVFLVYFRSYYLKYKKWVVYGLLMFGLTLMPHVVTIASGAFFSRFNQVSSSGNNFFLLEFGKHFITYFSPKYLFSDTGNGLARVSPGLSVFYDWFFFPFLAGLYFFSKFIDKKLIKFIGLFTLISLVPVSLTGDIFYPLRALEFFWLLSLIVSMGILGIWEIIKQKTIKWLAFLTLIIYSLGSFYVSYFIFFQHETTENAGNTYFELSRELGKYDGYNIVLDSTRDSAAGLRVAYFRKYNSKKLQTFLKSQLTTPYYSSQVNSQEFYVVDNIEARSVDWKKDRCSPKTILVGDGLAFSGQQIKEHNLTKLFEIKGINKNVVLYGYETSPDKKCIINL